MSPKRFFLALSVLAAVSVAADGYYFFLATTNFRAKEAELGKIKADIQLQQSQADDFLTLAKNFQTAVAPKLSLLDKALPAQKDEGGINAAISDLAKHSGVVLSSEGITFGNTSGTSIPIQFSVSGKYAQIQTFLQGMENMDRQNDVNSVALNVSTGIVTAQLNVNMFIQP